MEKNKLLQLIESGYTLTEFKKGDIFFALRAPIDCSKGDDMITSFDTRFPNYKEKVFTLTKELMKDLKGRKRDLEIHFIDDGNGIDLAYHHQDETYCYVNKTPNVVINFQDAVFKFKNDHKTNLLVDVKNLGCPDFIVIPVSDLNEFNDASHHRAEFCFSIYNSKGEPRRENRVSLVMKYIDSGNNVKMCFDTFDPHP